MVQPMTKKNSYTFKLDIQEQKELQQILQTGNYRPLTIEHTVIAAEAENCRIALYKSGKCLIQGKGAEEWVQFVLEPSVLKHASVGYEDILNPELSRPHMGIDESGKGDFFGPLVIAAVYVDETTVPTLRDLGVKDSKAITSDKKAMAMAKEIQTIVDQKFAIVTIGSEAYNRLYNKMRNVNQMLAWGHARAIENVLGKVPTCPRALSDQFGPKRQIEQSLMKKGKSITLEQRPRAESDMAVAAASIIARSVFVYNLQKMAKDFDTPIPKGASAKVKESARDLIEKFGPEILLKTSKCHFKTTDEVLGDCGYSRQVLGPDGMAKSKAYVRRK